MRGCLGFLTLVALLLAGFALAITLLLPTAIAAQVRDSPLLRGQPVEVDVQTSLTGLFLHGTIDRITISGEGLREPEASVGTAQIDLTNVSILDRAFASATGTLTDVTVDGASAVPLPLGTVTLGGSSRDLSAIADIDAAAAATAIKGSFVAAGVPVEAVSLAAGRIDLAIAGRTITARPVITSTEVRLEAEGLASLPIVRLPATGEWRITAITITPGGIRVTALVRLG